MNNTINFSDLILKILLASFSTVGLIEWIKNFIKTQKTWIYSIIMPFFAIGCYLACEFLPIYLIGSIITVGAVQINYQIIIEGFKKYFNNKISSNNNKETENNESGE